MEKKTNENIIKAFEGLGKAICAMNMEGLPLLQHKIEKWIAGDDPDKVADYFVRIFNNNEYTREEFVDQFVGHVPPESKDRVDSVEAAVMAIDYLKSKGWRVKLANDYKGMGKQIVVISPDQSYWYHSKYDWSKEV